MKHYIFFLVLLLGIKAQAQDAATDRLGSWWMYFGNTKISTHYSLHTEAQLRLYETTSNFNQLLLRVGINRHLSPQGMLTLGWAYIPTETLNQEGQKSNSTEHRLWQQLILNNRLSRLQLEHRYRIEQRWINTEPADKYLNRLRYRLLLNIPLNNAEMTDKTVFVSVYDEIFLNVTETPFDQNRLYAALGYKFNKSLSMQAGYLRHRLGSNNYNRLQLGVYINTDLSKSAN